MKEKFILLVSLIVFLALCFPILLFGQRTTSALEMPTMPIPQGPIIPNPGYNNYLPNHYQTPKSTSPHVLDNPQQRNATLIREIEEYQTYINNQQIQNERDAEYLIKNGFPFQGNNPVLTGTEHYYAAFDTINQMLSGRLPLNLRKAIFLVENAYYENKLNYSDYEKALKEEANFCRMVMQEEKVDSSKNMAKNMILFRLITDTLQAKLKGNEKPLTHYPVNYDYEDFKSEKNYDSHFVTKLIRTNEGQCNSMPLY